MIASAVVLALGAGLVLAGNGPIPYTPTVQQAGSSAQMCWGADTDGVWTGATISLMTGDNYHMQHLQDLASPVDMTKDGCITYTVPQVSQYTYGYFFQATFNGLYTWSSRFIISSPNGETSAPAHASQTDGAAIPWADGTIINAASTAASTSVSASTPSSVLSSSSQQQSGSVSASQSQTAASSSSTVVSNASSNLVAPSVSMPASQPNASGSMTASSPNGPKRSDKSGSAGASRSQSAKNSGSTGRQTGSNGIQNQSGASSLVLSTMVGLSAALLLLL